MQILYQIYFGGLVVGGLVSLRLGTMVISTVSPWLGIGEDASANYCSAFGAVVLRVVLALTPWIKITTVDGKPLEWPQPVAGSPAPFFLMNHSSFLDFFVFSTQVPTALYFQFSLRTMIKAALFKLPLYGPSVGVACKAFPVHFTKDEVGSFKVDPEKQKVVMEKVDRHIEAGGSIGLCPEGQISKAPPTPLQPFRRGSFAVPLKHKMPIWGMTMVGCHESWPRHQQIGGLPATVHIALEHLYTPADGDTHADVADKCQAAMQNRVDAIIKIREEAKKQL